MVVLFLLLSLTLTVSSEEQFSLAEFFYESGNYRDAIAEYERFLYFFPEDSLVGVANRRLFLCYAFSDRLREARFLATGEDSLIMLSFLSMHEGNPYRTLSLLRALQSPDTVVVKAYILGLRGDWQAGAELTKGFPLFPLFAEASRLPKKSPIIAGCLSLVLPGAGRAYIGRWKDGLLSFAVVGGLWYLTYMYYSEGRPLPTAICGCLALTFHLGEIYGSAMEAINVYRIPARRIRAHIKSGIEQGLLEPLR